MKKNHSKARENKSSINKLPSKVKKFSFIALFIAGSGIFGYKVHDAIEENKREAIIRNMIEEDPLHYAKSIYATEVNKKEGTSYTSENIKFKLSNYMKDDGSYYKLHLRNIGDIKYYVLEEVNYNDKNAYVLTAYIDQDGETGRTEKTAELKKWFDSAEYLNVYPEGTEVDVDNYSENTITKCGTIVNSAIAYDQPKSYKTKKNGEKKCIEASKEYFADVTTEDLEKIAKSIEEKGVIDSSLYWKEEMDVSDQDVAESINNEWKEELKVIEPVYYSKDDQETTEKYIDKEKDNYKE